MTILELDGRLILKWNHPPGYSIEGKLRAEGFCWNQGRRAWEKEAKPGLREAILTALGYRPASLSLPPKENATAAIVEHHATYRITGEWPVRMPAHKAIQGYMRLLNVKQLAFKVEQYENKEEWECKVWQRGAYYSTFGPVYPIKGLHLVCGPVDHRLAIQVSAIGFDNYFKEGDTVIFDKGFNKKGIAPKITKEG